MKSSIPMIAVAFLALASCSQHEPVAPLPPANTATTPRQPKEQVKQRQYLALPGQSAIRVATADTDEAFERQVAAYGDTTVAGSPAEPGYTQPTQTYTDYTHQDTAGQQVVQDPPPYNPPAVVVNDPGTSYVPAAPGNGIDNVNQGFAGGAAMAGADAIPAYNPEAKADYAVQITNATTGRIYVEAQDAANHIFPMGPMFGGQSINTPPDPIGDLQGPITVIIRDPDKDGAPEIRRYKVPVHPNYKGKTLGVTILPGGQFRADLDNEIYYTFPEPQPGQETAQPAPQQATQPAPPAPQPVDTQAR